MNFIKILLKSILGKKVIIQQSIIKKSIKYKINSLFRKDSISLKSNYTILSKKGSSVFFGYYDVSPFNINGNKILSNSFSGHGSLDIGFFTKKNVFNKVYETNTWNFQMGCRLQWLNNTSEHILFNDFIDNNYKTIELSIIHNKIINVFDRPIYEQSPDSTFYLSLDFSRLGRLRPGYGYDNKIDDTIDQLIPDDNGVWLINMKTKKEKLLFTIKEVGDYVGISYGEQYFNHMMISPKSDKFLFFHVTNLDNKRTINLLLYDFTSNSYKLLNNSGHISHCNWIDNNSFIAYSTDINLGKGFIIYNIDGGKTEKTIIKNKLLKDDGHPTYNSNDHSILLDTYPDKYGEQTLMKYKMKSDEVEILSKEFLPPEYYSEYRCDLHPRYSTKFDQICIDTIVKGERVMKIILI